MKKFLLGLMVFLMSAGTASAQIATVQGFGVDRNSALRDAERNAVEEIAGTFIDSRTLVSNAVVALDEIYSKSNGFVRGSKILQERNTADGYFVKAEVDVDTSPNAALISRLSTLIRLNDPRIAVVALNGFAHDDYIEETMNEKLIEMGFSHIVDANLVASLHDAQLLEQIYSGRVGAGQVGSSFGADYVVIGKLNTDSRKIEIPDFKGGSIDTKMVAGNASMNVKIIRLATGEIIETFVVDGSGTDLDSKSASNRARADMALKAAKKLEDKFKKIGAKSSTSYQVIAYTNDYSKVEKLAADLRNVAGVGNVYIREHNGVKAIIEFDSAQVPATINQMLRNSSSLRLRVDGITGSSISYFIM